MTPIGLLLALALMPLQSPPCVRVPDLEAGRAYQFKEYKLDVAWDRFDKETIPRVDVLIAAGKEPPVVRSVRRDESSVTFRFSREGQYAVSVATPGCGILAFETIAPPPERPTNLYVTPTIGLTDGFKPAVGGTVFIRRFGVAAAYAPSLWRADDGALDFEVSMRNTRSTAGIGYRRRFGLEELRASDPDEIRRDRVGYAFYSLEMPPMTLFGTRMAALLGLEIRALPVPGQKNEWRHLRGLGLRLQFRRWDDWSR